MGLFDFIYKLNYKIIMKDYILLESNPDYSDNTKAVYDELLRRKMNKNYKIIWLVDDVDQFKDIKVNNVVFVQRDKKIQHLIPFIYYNLLSKYIIDCNKCIKKRNKNQFRIYLTHGTPLKMVKNYIENVGNMDYLIQTSDFFTDVYKKFLKSDHVQIISTGFPRNDVLFNSTSKIAFFEETRRKKTILWLPTYRNHKGIKDDFNFHVKVDFPYGIPIISESNDLLKLNKILLKKEILLIVKLHPAEDSSRLKKMNCSNIKLIDDSIFKNGYISLYTLLSSVDALITDYSSVYYDFLLTDKPIGLAIPDIDIYRKHVNLIYDNFQENIIGEYIYDYTDLVRFIDNVSRNRDLYFDERVKMKKKYHKFLDGNSSKRVVDILENQMKGGSNEKRN